MLTTEAMVSEIPNVSTRQDGTIRHFHSSEMANGAQYPGGAPDLDLLWSMFDWIPEGRGTDWYPKLDYSHK
jgi:predicted dithiol-disulfide oxidoreductase (DUF899 family)